MARKKAKKSRRKAAQKVWWLAGGGGETGAVYEFEVWLIAGMVTEEFARKNPKVMRAIQIRGGQTLEDLHRAIFKAFGRYDEHLYEFQFDCEEPMDHNARRYVTAFARDDPFDDRPPAGDVGRTTVASLGLNMGDYFFYWFDFGDDWWHRIELTAIPDEAPVGRYPKVTRTIGENPPQYLGTEDDEWDGDEDDDWDDEDDDWDEDDDEDEDWDDESEEPP